MEPLRGISDETFESLRSEEAKSATCHQTVPLEPTSLGEFPSSRGPQDILRFLGLTRSDLLRTWKARNSGSRVPGWCFKGLCKRRLHKTIFAFLPVHSCDYPHVIVTDSLSFSPSTAAFLPLFAAPPPHPGGPHTGCVVSTSFTLMVWCDISAWHCENCHTA